MLIKIRSKHINPDHIIGIRPMGTGQYTEVMLTDPARSFTIDESADDVAEMITKAVIDMKKKYILGDFVSKLD